MKPTVYVIKRYPIKIDSCFSYNILGKSMDNSTGKTILKWSFHQLKIINTSNIEF